MGTRCLIGYLNKDSGSWKVRYTYCHYDGYPNGVGKVLYEHYNYPILAEKLCSLNGFPTLSNTYEETKRDEYPEDAGGSVSYNTFMSLREWDPDYVYLYTPYDTNHGNWTVRPVFGYPLSEMAENESWENY